MRIVRYAADGGQHYGILTDGAVHTLRGPLTDAEPGEAVGELDQIQLLAPATPSKVLCVGRNYAAHIKEMGRPFPEYPFFFLKSPNAVVGPDAPVLRPEGVERFDYEAEQAVVIGRRASRLTADNWQSFVLGYTCGNDMTVRDWQNSDGQWARAKSADTLCPLGPWVETEVRDPHDVKVRASVNGEIRQDGSTSDLVFNIGQLLEFITASITLEPGDVVLTGTPGGVSNVDHGDVIEIEIGDIGPLRNPVKTAGR